MKKDTIHIKAKNKGKLHKELGVKSGTKISTKKLSAAKKKAVKTGNTKLEKRIVFAENAKKWNHKKGGK